MKKNQEPEVPPEETAIEERVRRLMDITAPDDLPASGTPINDVTAAPLPPPPDSEIITPATPLAIQVNEVEPAASSPLLSTPVVTTKRLGKRVEPVAEAQLQPAAKKSIVITHFNDTDEQIEPASPAVSIPVSAKAVVPATPAAKPTKKIIVIPDNAEDSLQAVENPLIPTDKLTQTITPKVTAVKNQTISKSKTKKLPLASLPLKKTAIIPSDVTAAVVEPSTNAGTEISDDAEAAGMAELKSVDEPFVDIDSEIAEAFEQSHDEFDELAAEVPSPMLPVPAALPPELEPELESDPQPELDPDPEPESELDVPTAPEVLSQPVTTPPKPKFDKFKPLTDIRPQLPSALKPVLKLDDVATSQAVDEIVVAESDKLLDLPADSIPKLAIQPQAIHKSKHHHRPARLKPGKKFRRAAIIVFIVAVAAAGAIPVSRVAVLTALGVRTSASLTILDQSTEQPLKNVNLMIDGKSASSDARGFVTLSGLKLGTASMTLQRRAYAPFTNVVKLGLGSNKLSAISLLPTGTQHTVMVVDYLTGKPVKALIDSGLGSAQADGSGLAKLTIDKAETKSFTATISANGYRSEAITIDPTSTDSMTFKLILSHKYAYMDKRSGTLDVYTSDLDGQHEQLVLKGTGNEDIKTTVLVANPTDNEAALISTRSSGKASDGSLLSTLTLINLRTATTATVTQAVHLQVIDWFGQRLVYAQISADSKATDPNRQQLLSYDYKTKQSQQLASANYFNNVLTAGGKVFYAPSSAYQPLSNVGFYQINADGSAKQTILPLETWNVYRTSFDHLSLSVQQDWYDFKLGDKLASKQSAAPASLDDLHYVESPDGQHGLRVTATTGRATLVVFNKNASKENDLITENGLSYPLQWLNNTTIVYRITSSQEVADYAYSLDGASQPKKIHDLVDIPGTTSWQVH